jgi:hypothetical protein
MAIAHSTSTARSGRTHRARAAGSRRKSAKRSKILVKGRKTAGTQTPGAAAADKSAMPIAAGSPIRVPRRLQGMIQAEMRNLERAEAMLRCLGGAMEFVDLGDKGAPCFADIVEVAADLVWRSKVDLEDLYFGRIADPLMAALRVER